MKVVNLAVLMPNFRTSWLMNSGQAGSPARTEMDTLQITLESFEYPQWWNLLYISKFFSP